MLKKLSWKTQKLFKRAMKQAKVEVPNFKQDPLQLGKVFHKKLEEMIKKQKKGIKGNQHDSK